MNAICGQGYDTSFCYIMQTGPGWNLGKIKRTHTHIKGKKKQEGWAAVSGWVPVERVDGEKATPVVITKIAWWSILSLASSIIVHG